MKKGPLEKIKAKEAAIEAAEQRIASEEAKIVAARKRITAERKTIRKLQEEILQFKTSLLTDRLRQMDNPPIEEVLEALSLIDSKSGDFQHPAVSTSECETSSRQGW